MKTLQHGLGYHLVDHRDSPGTAAAPGGQQHERDFALCSHCQRQVLLNPGRVRVRAVCPKCHAYICDTCEAVRVASGGACVPFVAVLDRAQELLTQYAGQPDHPALQILQDPLALMAPTPTVRVAGAKPLA